MSKQLVSMAYTIGIALTLLFQCHTAYADDVECTEQSDFPRCLTGNVPSYIALVNDGEEHAEFTISIKYPLWGQGKKKSFYFSYQGDYDFYVKTRDSSPIVSRRQNPGGFYQQKLLRNNDYGFQKFRIGWYHESNGQHIDEKTEFDASDNPTDHISRGWDYLGIDLKHRLPLSRHNLYLYTSINLYCDCQAFGFVDKEDEIFWKEVDEQPDVRDYNGLKFILSYTTSRDMRFSGIMRTGNKNADALTNASFRFEAVYPVGNIHLLLFYFDGYGINISTYHERDTYYGLGVEFW